MDNAATFKSFFDSIRMQSRQQYSGGLDGLSKKLNFTYYSDADSQENDHLIVVGSVGRGTAVDGCSDVDALFVLPQEVFSRMNGRQGNIQSQLLSGIRETLKERYPKSSIKGDGQAVVVDFTDRGYTIDLVPCFESAEKGFTYPDSNNGGHWKLTNPIPEQQACAEDALASGDNFLCLCNALRVWKDNRGFAFGGLLIDTLVDKFLADHPSHKFAAYGDYIDVFTDLFDFLSNQNAEQKYWHALGSNQEIINKDGAPFVAKASDALDCLRSEGIDSEQALIEIFGRRFEKCVTSSVVSATASRWSSVYDYVPDSEQFIEQMFPVHIRYNLTIDCTVTQSGFRPDSLLNMLRRRLPLRKDKQLDFSIEKCNVPEPYEVYWKVRNCGEEAYRRKCVRGQICEDKGGKKWHEHTDFNGDHYVECYVVKHGVCVARDKIKVPIRV